MTREAGSAPPDAVRSLRERLDRLVVERQELKDKAAREHAKLLEQVAKAQSLDDANAVKSEQIRHLKAQYARLHRSAPSTGIIRGLMASRLVVAQHRAAEAGTRDRLARFISSSPSYARQRTTPQASPQLVRSTSDAVAYWIPALHPKDAAPDSPWLRKQAVPYRTVLQTREVAIGGIMLDLGANIGHTAVSRVVLGDVTAAYCAEPDALNHEALVRTVMESGLEGLVLPDRVAIGARSGTAQLRQSRFPGGHQVVSGAGAADVVEVEMLTLDDWVRRHAIPLPLVTFVKVDVQGLESQVLDGASEVLSARHIAWQLEFGLGTLRESGVDPAAHLERLRAHFTHFTDLNKNAVGERGRPTAELQEALAYLEGAPDGGHTDLLLFNLESTPT